MSHIFYWRKDQEPNCFKWRNQSSSVIAPNNTGKFRYTRFRSLADTFKDQLHQITMLIIRASPEARVKVLDFFALAINLNKKRGAIQVKIFQET